MTFDFDEKFYKDAIKVLFIMYFLYYVNLITYDKDLNIKYTNKNKILEID